MLNLNKVDNTQIKAQNYLTDQVFKFNSLIYICLV